MQRGVVGAEGLSWGPRILVGATIPWSALGRGTLAVWHHPQWLLHTPKEGKPGPELQGVCEEASGRRW